MQSLLQSLVGHGGSLSDTSLKTVAAGEPRVDWYLACNLQSGSRRWLPVVRRQGRCFGIATNKNKTMSGVKGQILEGKMSRLTVEITARE